MLKTRYYLIFTLLLFITIGIAACSPPDINSKLSKSQHDHSAHKKDASRPDVKTNSTENKVKNNDVSYYYTCPMHPEVRENKPGNCPKCNMTLIKKEIKKNEKS